MTQRFLDIFFRGRWHHYGHWSACLILCLTAATVLPWWAAGITGFTLMALWEAVQWQVDSGWNWRDILYNASGLATFLVIQGAASLIRLLHVTLF